MVLLLVKMVPKLSFLVLKHIKTFVLVELVPTEADQIINKTAWFGNVDDVCFSKGLQEFQ